MRILFFNEYNTCAKDEAEDGVIGYKALKVVLTGHG
jgi:hypothetical protein